MKLVLKKIRQNNSQKFLDDLKRVSVVLVYAKCSSDFFNTTKRVVMKRAETREIHYYITDEIFRRKRDVMVII